MDTNYRCKHCGHRFVHENRFIKHRCKQMQREELFKEPVGQAAWIYYQAWMKAYKKAAHNASAFLHSKFFISFIKFAQFVKKVKIPDTDLYIGLMKDHDISPTIWTSDEVYVLFLEYMDKKVPPQKLVEITINTLFDCAEEASVDVSQVFDTLTPTEVIQLMRERKISPWILLNSSKFTQFFLHKTTPDDRIIMESIIRPHIWKKKFEANPDFVDQTKTYVRELKL